jgi:hypothetical protein
MSVLTFGLVLAVASHAGAQETYAICSPGSVSPVSASSNNAVTPKR